METLISAIKLLSQIITLAVLADIIVSFLLSPYHQVRRFLDSIVDPMLAPIRRVLPAMAGLDFSPMVLIILIQILEGVLIALLRGIVG